MSKSEEKFPWGVDNRELELKRHHLEKARAWLIENGIDDPTDRLAQKIAKETTDFILGKRRD